MQFPTPLAVTQANINVLPWNAFTGRRIQPEFVVLWHMFSLAAGLCRIFPKSHPSWNGATAAQPSPAQGWSPAGARVELGVQQSKPRVCLRLPISSPDLGGRTGLGACGKVGLESSPRTCDHGLRLFLGRIRMDFRNTSFT